MICTYISWCEGNISVGVRVVCTYIRWCEDSISVGLGQYVHISVGLRVVYRLV